MTLFESAFKARIPFIGVSYNDPVNFKAILADVVGKQVQPLPKTSQVTVGDHYVYWTEKLEDVTSDMYRKLCANGAVCVVLNQHPSTIVFDAGSLPTPSKFMQAYLTPFVQPDAVAGILQSIAGLALKDAQNLVQLSMVMTGEITPASIRKTKLVLNGATPGLDNLSTDCGFYQMPKVVEDWIKLNDSYFLDPKVPEKLVPRGLMAVGVPGVGKTSLAQALARNWGVPLYRLDISSSLSKWLGAAEDRIAKNLQIVEDSAPCVLLIDETEKMFTQGSNEVTMPRILSQLLWWLQYRKGRVLTVMTSNDISNVPKELYREGRIDKVIELQKLGLSEAKTFAVSVYKSILDNITPHKIKVLREMLDKTEQGSFSHAAVVELVVEIIKLRTWDKDETTESN